MKIDDEAESREYRRGFKALKGSKYDREAYAEQFLREALMDVTLHQKHPSHQTKGELLLDYTRGVWLDMMREGSPHNEWPRHFWEAMSRLRENLTDREMDIALGLAKHRAFKDFHDPQLMLDMLPYASAAERFHLRNLAQQPPPAPPAPPLTYWDHLDLD